MIGQGDDPVQRIEGWIAGLQGKPLVDHEGLGVPALEEVVQRPVESRAAETEQGRQPAHHVGHVRACLIMGLSAGSDGIARLCGQQIERGVSQGAPSCAHRVG